MFYNILCSLLAIMCDYNTCCECTSCLGCVSNSRGTSVNAAIQLDQWYNTIDVWHEHNVSSVSFAFI